jgi:hypothetical protein
MVAASLATFFKVTFFQVQLQPEHQVFFYGFLLAANH